jgi:hypothetical protein
LSRANRALRVVKETPALRVFLVLRVLPVLRASEEPMDLRDSRVNRGSLVIPECASEQRDQLLVKGKETWVQVIVEGHKTIWNVCIMRRGLKTTKKGERKGKWSIVSN